MTDDLVAKLRDEDSYYRLQEKHWCIDAEELERQRLAAADLIEALSAENATLRAAQEDDSEMLTIAWMDGSHRSTKAHRARIEALSARVAELSGALKPFCDIDLTTDQLGSDFAWDVLRARAALKDKDAEG